MMRMMVRSVMRLNRMFCWMVFCLIPILMFILPFCFFFI